MWGPATFIPPALTAAPLCRLPRRAAAFTGSKGAEQEAFLLLDLCHESLVDFMRGQEGKLPSAGILQIFSAVCQAVSAMHQQQPPLIHRCLPSRRALPRLKQAPARAEQMTCARACQRHGPEQGVQPSERVACRSLGRVQLRTRQAAPYQQGCAHLPLSFAMPTLHPQPTCPHLQAMIANHDSGLRSRLATRLCSPCRSDCLHRSTRFGPPRSDLKAENVLRHANGDWVLCDFGSTTDRPAVYASSDAVLMGEEEVRKYTTPAYRAPEARPSPSRLTAAPPAYVLCC